MSRINSNFIVRTVVRGIIYFFLYRLLRAIFSQRSRGALKTKCIYKGEGVIEGIRVHKTHKVAAGFSLFITWATFALMCWVLFRLICVVIL
jgi:hypothetical protein